MTTNDDLNELFPDREPDEPADNEEPTEEHMREIAGMLEDMSLEESADGIETTMRDMAGKFAFELLLTLLNPTPKSRATMVNGLIRMAAKRVEGDVNEQIRDMEDSEAVALGKHVNVAFARAEKKFREDFENSFFDDEFMERCRRAIRKNLSR
jgi:hypothetical protein